MSNIFTCRHCCALFLKNRKSRNRAGRGETFCSLECSYKHRSLLAKAAALARPLRIVSIVREHDRRDRAPERVCRQCGAKYKSLARKVFCSPRCRYKFDKRVTDLVRRHKKRSQTPDKLCIEPFGDWEIFRRDNYTCKVCGERVRLDVPILHNLAPSVDHIIPIAKGGSHTRDNVQTAHRFCNSLKADHLIPPMFFAAPGMGVANA